MISFGRNANTRTPARNANEPNSASFLHFSKRGGATPSHVPALIREARLMSPCERATSYDATSRRNLASDGFIVIARSLIPAREQSLRLQSSENPERNRANTLGRVGAMRCKSSSHGRQQTMRGISGGTIQVTKRANHV